LLERLAGRVEKAPQPTAGNQPTSEELRRTADECREAAYANLERLRVINRYAVQLSPADAAEALRNAAHIHTYGERDYCTFCGQNRPDA
jgi:hypothetical protein